eukprot:5755907-Alexandrium_andersonii.AAC.1
MIKLLYLLCLRAGRTPRKEVGRVVTPRSKPLHGGQLPRGRDRHPRVRPDRGGSRFGRSSLRRA